MKTFIILSFCLILYSCNPALEEDLVITEFQEGKEINKYYYLGYILQKQEFFNIKKGGRESILEYVYKEKIIDTVLVDGVDMDDTRQMKEGIVKRDFLKSKGINFLFPEIISSDVSDLSNIFSVADNYDDYSKIDSMTMDSTRIIKFVKFNKNIRFTPSLLTMFIHNNTIIKDYQINIKNHQPIKEYYTTRDGVLFKEYVYKDKKLVQLLYKVIDDDKEEIVFEKKFEYKK